MKIITLFLICATFSECSPVYYVPNTQNVPAITEKGQTNISFGLSSSESVDGIEFQGAYGLTDKIALQFNGDWVEGSDDTSNYSYNLFGSGTSSYKKTSNGSGHIIEFGPGYYKNLSEHFVFETYGLVGFGGLKYEENNTNYQSIKANFLRIAAQPSISFTSKYFIASFSNRISNLNYSSIGGNYYDVEYLKANNSQWLFEPALTLQAGIKNIKLQLQYQHSINLTDSNFPQDYDFVSLGLKVNFNALKN